MGVKSKFVFRFLIASLDPIGTSDSKTRLNSHVARVMDNGGKPPLPILSCLGV